MDVTVLGGETWRRPEAVSRKPFVLESELMPADPGALDRLRAGIADTDLAAPPVVLPDFHHKAKLEMPSSIAVATTGSIRPTLTSSSVNCGMALIAVDTDMPSRAAMDDFFRRVRERYPYPPTNRAELSRLDVLQCALRGADFAFDHFGADPDGAERVEEDGRIDVDELGGVDAMRRQIPRLITEFARLRFGTIGPSNHFVELQQVEEVLDPRAAELLGVRQGQLVIQFHAGGGVLAGAVGRLFGRRSDYPRHLRRVMRVQKPLYHLATAQSVTQLRERLALYFGEGCPPVPLDSDEGRRLMLANAAAMNYGFAFRIATYAALQQIAREVFGASSRLVVDSPHNSIYLEEVDGVRAVVHRHNACRAYPKERMRPGTTFAETGQAVLLPGTNRTSSYLGVAAAAARTSLYSACHGAGTVVADFEQRGLSHPDPLHRVTLRYRYDGTAPSEIPQLDDVGVNEAMSVLADYGVVTPTARLRPLAGLT